MSVEFDEETLSAPRYQSRTIIGRPVTPSLSTLFVKLGIVKSNDQAYKFMILLVVVSIIAAVLIYYFFVVHSGHSPVPANAIYEKS